MKEPIYRVLFLCTGNSARSILAECVLNKVGRGRFEAHSAGSAPRGDVHPRALDVLRSNGYETAGLRSKSWDEYCGPQAQPFDFVFTLCDSAAAESCPLPTGSVTAHWSLPDPAAVVGTDVAEHAAFVDTLRELTRRLTAFVHLPLEGLDRTRLQRRLSELAQETAGRS